MKIFKNTDKFRRASAKFRVVALVGLIGAGGSGWWYLSDMVKTIPEDTQEEREQMDAAKSEVKKSETKQGLADVIGSLIDYDLKFEKYPTTDEGLAILVEQEMLEEAALKDPYGNPYNYEGSAGESLFTLFSSGPDGKPGTADDIQADLSALK